MAVLQTCMARNQPSHCVQRASGTGNGGGSERNSPSTAGMQVGVPWEPGKTAWPLVDIAAAAEPCLPFLACSVKNIQMDQAPVAMAAALTVDPWAKWVRKRNSQGTGQAQLPHNPACSRLQLQLPLSSSARLPSNPRGVGRTAVGEACTAVRTVHSHVAEGLNPQPLGLPPVICLHVPSSCMSSAYVHAVLSC